MPWYRSPGGLWKQRALPPCCSSRRCPGGQTAPPDQMCRRCDLWVSIVPATVECRLSTGPSHRRQKGRPVQHPQLKFPTHQSNSGVLSNTGRHSERNSPSSSPASPGMTDRLEPVAPKVLVALPGVRLATRKSACVDPTKTPPMEASHPAVAWQAPITQAAASSMRRCWGSMRAASALPSPKAPGSNP